MQLGLGTVQFGLDYGVTNRVGQVAEPEVESILKLADEKGIFYFDTAIGYGVSERLLGEYLPGKMSKRVVTKTPHLAVDLVGDREIDLIREAFDKSMSRLGLNEIYGLIIHNANDLHKAGAERIFELFRELKAAGKVQKIGASIYDESDFLTVMPYKPDLMQVPCNVFDQRLVQKMSENSDIEYHIRSAFLQGILLDASQLLDPFFEPVLNEAKRFHKWCEGHGKTPLQMCLQFFRQMKFVDCVLVGVTNTAELQQILQAWQSQFEADLDFGQFNWQGEARYIDPRRWPSK